MSHVRKGLTVQEITALLEEESDNEEDEPIDIVCIPPTVDALTDEEDIDDNETGVLNASRAPHDITGTLELHTTRTNELSEDPQPSTSASNPDTSTNSAPKRARLNPPQVTVRMKSKKKIVEQPSWTKSKPRYSMQPLNNEKSALENVQTQCEGKTPFEVFSLFFDTDLCDSIVEYSERYSRFCNNHDFTFNAVELRKFLGILILSGYHTLPQVDMYWSKDEDKEVPLVRSTMSRNRFRTIKRYIHVADNEDLDKSDKFAKLRPLFDELNKKFLQFGIFSHNISIDEEMVPYFGRHSAKMFIRGKPVRFGFKLWSMTSSDGYLYQFSPYGGASVVSNDAGLGMGAQVVLDLLSFVESPREHKIYFDNFFASYGLMCELKERGFFAIGTIRENRLQNCPIQTTKELGKQKRGTFDAAFDKKKEVLAVRWNDNSVVTMVTNCGTVSPLVGAKRYNRKEKKSDVVTQPNVIASYNKHMGGVDLHDNGIANYRIRIRGKKWWWSLFINAVDSSIVNAWKIYSFQ